MDPNQRLKLTAYGLLYGFVGPAALMLGLPPFGFHSGYWGCFWLMTAVDCVTGTAAVSLARWKS